MLARGRSPVSEVTWERSTSSQPISSLEGIRRPSAPGGVVDAGLNSLSSRRGANAGAHVVDRSALRGGTTLAVQPPATASTIGDVSCSGRLASSLSRVPVRRHPAACVMRRRAPTFWRKRAGDPPSSLPSTPQRRVTRSFPSPLPSAKAGTPLRKSTLTVLTGGLPAFLPPRSPARAGLHAVRRSSGSKIDCHSASRSKLSTFGQLLENSASISQCRSGRLDRTRRVTWGLGAPTHSSGRALALALERRLGSRARARLLGLLGIFERPILACRTPGITGHASPQPIVMSMDAPPASSLDRNWGRAAVKSRPTSFMTSMTSGWTPSTGAVPAEMAIAFEGSASSS